MVSKLKSNDQWGAWNLGIRLRERGSPNLLSYVGVFLTTETKVCGCSFFSRSPTFSTDWIHSMKLVLHQQIYDETYAKIGLKFGAPFTWLWLSEACVCWFLNWIYGSSQLNSSLRECKGVGISIWRHTPNSFNLCLYVVLLFDMNQTTYQSSRRVRFMVLSLFFFSFLITHVYQLSGQNTCIFRFVTTSHLG